MNVLFIRNIRFIVFLILMGLASTMESYSQSNIHQFKAGFAETDLTPDIGMERPGGYGKSFHQRFNDRCKVRTVVFDDGEKVVALIGLDLLFVRRDIVKEVREEIAKKTGIPAEAIMISATHNHSAGPISFHQAEKFENSSDLVKELVFEKSIASDPGFTQYLKSQLVKSVDLAYHRRVPAKYAVGIGHEDKVSYNRRLRMKNGLTYSHPRPGNPDVIDYAGPIDPDVGTIGVWDLEGNLLGVVVNFANHNTTNPPAISANWVGAMEETMRKATGNAALPVVCMLGPCGDITQVDNLTKYKNPGGEEWRRIVGGRIGAEAFKTLLLIERGASEEMKVDYRSALWKIDRRRPSAEKVARAIEMVKKEPGEVGSTDWTFAKETVVLDALLEVEPSVEVEVQAIQIGPVAFVSNPAEYFVEDGLRIKEESDFPFTFVVELANGCVGYVPTEEAFGPHGGGYETRLTSYSNLEITAGTQIADRSIEILRGMKPGKVPEPEPAPAFDNNPWDYGNVPPEIE